MKLFEKVAAVLKLAFIVSRTFTFLPPLSFGFPVVIIVLLWQKSFMKITKNNTVLLLLHLF